MLLVFFSLLYAPFVVAAFPIGAILVWFYNPFGRSSDASRWVLVGLGCLFSLPAWFVVLGLWGGCLLSLWDCLKASALKLLIS